MIEVAAWKAWLRAQACARFPHWTPGQVGLRQPVPLPPRLRSVRTQQLQPLTPAPETGHLPRLRETAMIPAVKLLMPEVRQTRELVSSAVCWFVKKYGVLPQTVTLNPLRCLAVSDFFAVDGCEFFGCYTVRVCCDPGIAVDVVKLEGRKRPWSERLTAFYL